MSRIPVLDSSGNKLGDFIPEGGDGCGWLILAIATVLIVPLLFYAIYKLIAYVVNEAKKGNWGPASILTLITFEILFVLVSARFLPGTHGGIPGTSDTAIAIIMLEFILWIIYKAVYKRIEFWKKVLLKNTCLNWLFLSMAIVVAIITAALALFIRANGHLPW